MGPDQVLMRLIWPQVFQVGFFFRLLYVRGETLARAPEKYLDRFDLSIAEGEELGIADNPVVFGYHLDDCKCLLFISDDFGKFEPLDMLRLVPALCLEFIDRQMIVRRGTGEAEIFGQVAGDEIPVLRLPAGVIVFYYLFVHLVLIWLFRRLGTAAEQTGENAGQDGSRKPARSSRFERTG